MASDRAAYAKTGLKNGLYLARRGGYTGPSTGNPDDVRNYLQRTVGLPLHSAPADLRTCVAARAP